jgi:hypothetical protein
VDKLELERLAEQLARVMLFAPGARPGHGGARRHEPADQFIELVAGLPFPPRGHPEPAAGAAHAGQLAAAAA